MVSIRFTGTIRVDPEPAAPLGPKPIPKSRPSPAAPARWLIRAFPCLTDVVFLLPLFFLFLRVGGASALLRDADTGLQIRAGEWILAHQAVPRVDLFSFSKPGQPWFAWEWGWDVLAALLHGALGLDGFVFVHCCLLGLTAVAVFRLARRRSGHGILAFLITIIAIQASCVHWLARPHLLSWLFFASLLWLVEKSQTSPRLIVLVPALAMVWANLHGSFALTVVYMLAYALADLLAGLMIADGALRLTYLRRSGAFAVAAIVSLLSSAFNPYGVDLHRHVWSYLRDARQLNMIKEFQSFDFHQTPGQQIEILLALGVATAAWSLFRRRWADCLLTMFWLHLALQSARNIPLFAFAVTPPSALMIRELLRLAARSSGVRGVKQAARVALCAGQEFSQWELLERIHLPILVSLLGLALLLRGGVPDAFRARFDEKAFPVRALASLTANPPERMLTGDQWGSYLIYRSYPRLRVFIDDRSDFYGADFDSAAGRLLGAQYDWEQRLALYGIDAALLPPGDPLAAVLKLSPKWRVNYDDGTAILFRRVVANVAKMRGCNGSHHLDR